MSVKRFESKQEALKELDLQRNKMPRWFCPLIRETCRTDCVCFKRASLIKYDKGFLVYPKHCGNYSFFGGE